MLNVGLVVRLEAKAGAEQELAAFLTDARSLALDEAGTPLWLALRTNESTFWIVDAFPSDDERSAHLAGAIAVQLMTEADRLLAGPPEIAMADILAIKNTENANA